MKAKKKFGYITIECFEDLTGVLLEESGFEESFDDAVFTASETINAGCGNNIERVGIEHLSEVQQRAVKKATALLVKHYLKTGEIDIQIGSVSASMGGMSFAMSQDTDPSKLRYLPEVVVEILEQAGLLDQTVGIDPIRGKKAEKKPECYKYRRWGITSLDDSLYVSDGSTEDGGRVGLKISDDFQHEIHKVKVVEKEGNHLVYFNKVGWKAWPNHSLATMEAVREIPKS